MPVNELGSATALIAQMASSPKYETETFYKTGRTLAMTCVTVERGLLCC